MSPTPPHPASSTTPAISPAPRSSQRVLACILCQQRKIRCDRTFPCVNCQKQNAKCVPATQTRRRRKRFPERELLERLRRYEGLMRQHGVRFDPMHKEDDGDNKAEAGVSDDDEDDDDGVKSGPGLRTREASASSPSSASSKPYKLADVKSMWHAMSQEAPGPGPASTPIANAIETTVRSTWEHLIDGDNILFGSQQSAIDLSTFHPDPVGVFRLWQIYLANVDPLLKVTHAPTLQPRIVEAISDLQNIPPALEALMFSIYALAVQSQSEEACPVTLGMARDDLMTKYRFGTQQALLNAGYLHSLERECLTALYLHLLTLRADTNPRSRCVLVGLAVRIAQCMGINREQNLAKHSPFEAELRRRLWWSLVVYDARIAEKADCKDPNLAPTWDCQIPLNCDDAALWPDMKELPPNDDRASESIFIVLRSEVADFMRNCWWYLDFLNPALKPLARELPQGASIDAFHAQLEKDYLSSCNPEKPVHFLAIWIARSYILRSRLFSHYANFLSANGQQTEAERDAGLLIAIESLECDAVLMSSPLSARFRWYLISYFPFPSYMHVAQDLGRRPGNPLADRAWKAMHENYTARSFHKTKLVRSPVAAMFRRLMVAAWEAAQNVAPVAERQFMKTPDLIATIRHQEEVFSGLQNMSDLRSVPPFAVDHHDAAIPTPSTVDALGGAQLGDEDGGFASAGMTMDFPGNVGGSFLDFGTQDLMMGDNVQPFQTIFTQGAYNFAAGPMEWPPQAR